MSDGADPGFLRRLMARARARRPSPEDLLARAMEEARASRDRIVLPARPLLARLAVRAVHERRRSLEAMPGHEPGGAFTFVEAHLDGCDDALILLGLAEGADAGTRAPFGRGVVAARDGASGERTLAALAASLGLPVPPRGDAPIPPRPLACEIVTVGTAFERLPGGDFESGGGPWRITKWLLRDGTRHADLLVHLDLEGRRGEIAAKSAEESEDLLEILRRALRDGAPAAEPPEDEALGEGPRFVGWRPVGPPGAEPRGFSTDGSRLLLCAPEGDRDVLLVARLAEGTLVERGRFDGRVVRAIAADAGAARLLVWEMASREPGAVRLGSTPSRLWLLDGDARRELSGAWGAMRIHFAAAPLSPDGAFVAVTAWRPQAAGKRMYQVVHLLHLGTASSRLVEMPDVTLDVEAWRGEGPALRALMRTGTDEDAGDRYLVDPATGAMEPLARTAALSHHRLVAPGGARRLHVLEGRVEVEDVATGSRRRVAVPAEARRALAADAIEWCDGRYALLEADGPLLLDTDALTWSLPLGDEAPRRRILLAPGFDRVAALGDGVTLVADVAKG